MDKNIELPFISVVVGFRKRDVHRVALSLDSIDKQSYKNFEVIFIDYGSDNILTKEVEQVVASYSFAKYIYVNTSGWFWNRGHALNIGIEKAIGDVVLIYDIDLILEIDFLSKISVLKYESYFYTFNCYYLPQEFNLTEENLHNYNFYENYVGLAAIYKTHLASIYGFDEYYMVWGLEDDDLYYRLTQLGIKKKEHVASDYKVFHQWHSLSYSNIPTAWYYQMTKYYYSHKRHLINKNFLCEDPKRHLANIYLENRYENFISIKLKDKLITSFQNCWNQLEIMSSGEIRWFKFLKPQTIEKTNSDLFSSFINKILNRQNLLQYTLVKRLEINKSIRLNSDDVVNFVQFFVGTNRDLINDYYYKENDEFIFFIYEKM